MRIQRSSMDTWSRRKASVLLGMLIFFGTSLLTAQAKPTTEKPMKHFVMIFRVTRTLSDEEVRRRQVEIQQWVRKVTEMGVELYPYALGHVVANYSVKNERLEISSAPDDAQLSNIVFFDAPDLEEAKKVAESHPGLHYGTKLELREWTSPRAGATAPPIGTAK